jgi:hypothetical protein
MLVVLGPAGGAKRSFTTVMSSIQQQRSLLSQASWGDELNLEKKRKGKQEREACMAAACRNGRGGAKKLRQ